jgi:hypothetical protein
VKDVVLVALTGLASVLVAWMDSLSGRSTTKVAERLARLEEKVSQLEKKVK